MTNREAYAQGLLNRALDPVTQPRAIRDFLREEEALIARLVPERSRMVDLGCGTGRHLRRLADRISLGVGLDYEASYAAEAARLCVASHLHFFVADAAAAPLTASFDVAVCLGSTWGTMPGKRSVLREMRRLAPDPGIRFVTVYTPDSIDARVEWYARLGHPVTEVTDEFIEAAGFRSEHYTETRIRKLLHPSGLHRLGDIAYLALV